MKFSTLFTYFAASIFACAYYILRFLAGCFQWRPWQGDLLKEHTKVARHESDRVWDHVHYLNKEIKGLQHKIDATEREVLQAILAKKPDRYIACLKEEQNRLIYVRKVRLDQVVRLRDALAGVPRQLTRLEVVNSIAQPLVCSRPCTTATTDPYTALLHVPDKIEEWVGIEEAAIAFCTSIPDSEPLYKGWSPSNVKPSNKFTVQDCMDGIFFRLANQLGGSGGLADFNFCADPTGRRLQSSPDRVWMCGSVVIAAAECKQVYARPSLPGYGLLEEFRADPTGKVSTQLRQVCGHLHHNGLEYGLLYTDACFWFLRYTDSILYVSKGAYVTQQGPTVIAMLLYVGDLAHKAAVVSTPARRQLGIMLAFYGTLLRPSSADSEQLPAHHELRVDSILASGSTGSVRSGLLGNVEVAVKIPDVAEDGENACSRLASELSIYQDALLPLQGSCIPRVVAPGTIPTASGARHPFFAMDLLPYSLMQMLSALDDELEQSVLSSLQRIHEQGVLHGDVTPEHVRFSSQAELASTQVG